MLEGSLRHLHISRVLQDPLIESRSEMQLVSSGERLMIGYQRDKTVAGFGGTWDSLAEEIVTEWNEARWRA